MEGVTDAPMRALMTELGGFTHTVSEFVRVSQDVLSKKTLMDHVPELSKGAQTPNGYPVQVQLLGGNAERLALSAQVAVRAGAQAIDLNFGCPAPTVNRHDGGATLLQYPERIREIVQAVRSAVPKEYPVSAKLRLGWDSIDAIDRNAQEVALGGASWITIHGRTKTQGYRPPAYWQPIARVRKNLSIPVVANGEIWSLDDFKRCRDETQCMHFMIGRGALADPALSRQIGSELGTLSSAVAIPQSFNLDPSQWRAAVQRLEYFTTPESGQRKYLVRRIKQWVRMNDRQFGLSWWDRLKVCESLEDVLAALP
jgi:tRNA-dihydrouridine synthase C